jgi:hypothetical protein
MRADRLAWLGRWLYTPKVAGSTPARPTSNCHLLYFGIPAYPNEAGIWNLLMFSLISPYAFSASALGKSLNESGSPPNLSVNLTDERLSLYQDNV